jgi:hypothetical protein
VRITIIAAAYRALHTSPAAFAGTAITVRHL